MHIDLPRARLRRWQFGDEDALTRHASNEKIARYLRDAFPYPYTRSDARAFIRSASSQHPLLTFAIEVEGEPSGAISLHPGVDVYSHSAELGYWLGEAHWGKGIMTSATRAIAAYAFDDLGLQRIHAAVFATNDISVHVLKKVGFQLEGRARRAVYKHDHYLDELLYALLPEDLVRE